jgi:NitT/TauT family transport system substrate-binding protein
VADSFKEITFTNDPDESSLETQASWAEAVGIESSDDVTGIFDLTLLNKALSAAGEAQISS